MQHSQFLVSLLTRCLPCSSGRCHPLSYSRRRHLPPPVLKFPRERRGLDLRSESPRLQIGKKCGIRGSRRQAC